MTKKKEWSPYKAALRRKKIAEAKRMKADRYVDEMKVAYLVSECTG
jgi:hypothetical protein